MIQGFYNAKASIRARQKNMDSIANNMANINTDYYKKEEVSFADALYRQTMKEYPDQVSDTFQTGSSVRIEDIGRNLAQGDIVETENMADLALAGNGFLAAVDAEGQTIYSRGGRYSFELNEDGDKYLRLSSGAYLTDGEDKKIIIPGDVQEIEIDHAGIIGYGDNSVHTGLKLVQFQNPAGLDITEAGLYQITQESGEAEDQPARMVRQGFKELSNVDLAVEMSELIKNQRIFEFNTKVMQTIDEMQSMANHLRK
jgi:flagellar basal-body rod protein FlgG